MVAKDQQSLRTAPAESGRNDLVRIVHPIAIRIFQTPHVLAIADQQSPVAIEGQVVRAAGQPRFRSPVDVKPLRQVELVVQQNRRRGVELPMGQEHDRGE